MEGLGGVGWLVLIGMGWLVIVMMGGIVFFGEDGRWGLNRYIIFSSEKRKKVKERKESERKIRNFNRYANRRTTRLFMMRAQLQSSVCIFASAAPSTGPIHLSRR